MDPDLPRRIARAKELLRTCRHAAIATVNADGTPHNTPLFFMLDPELKYFYWGSHPDSLHSQNVLRTGRVFVVLYDAVERGGLYMSAGDAHALEGAELGKALAAHNKRRAEEGKDPLSLDYYSGDSPQRMWSARITRFWVNGEERDTEGHIARDGRVEISAEDLLSGAAT